MSEPLAPRPEQPSVPREEDARATLQGFRTFLQNPAFLHRLDLAVLTKLASDERTPVRERRHAAEALGMLYLRAVEVMGQLLREPEHVVGPWLPPSRHAGASVRARRSGGT